MDSGWQRFACLWRAIPWSHYPRHLGAQLLEGLRTQEADHLHHMDQRDGLCDCGFGQVNQDLGLLEENFSPLHYGLD